MEILKTSTELVGFLSELYSKERSARQNDTYLAHHGTPNDILQKIFTFLEYKHFLPDTGRILDWGCNHAPDSCLIRATFGSKYELHSCDFLAPNYFTFFQHAAKTEYRSLAECIKLPYDNDFFDTIVASGALEHVAFDSRSLEELHRVLKPDGTLIITYLPNALSYYEIFQERIRKKGFHMRRYTLSSAKKLLKSNGFFPIKAGYQTYFWERRLASIGLKRKSLLAKVLYCLFPIHLIGGCLQLVAIKKTYMS